MTSQEEVIESLRHRLVWETPRSTVPILGDLTREEPALSLLPKTNRSFDAKLNSMAELQLKASRLFDRVRLNFNSTNLPLTNVLNLLERGRNASR